MNNRQKIILTILTIIITTVSTALLIYVLTNYQLFRNCSSVATVGGQVHNGLIISITVSMIAFFRINYSEKMILTGYKLEPLIFFGIATGIFILNILTVDKCKSIIQILS